MNDVQKYQAVEKVIDETIRPYLIADGGNIELDMVKGNEVVISFQGACGSCPSSAGGTLAGIERALRHAVDPDIQVIPTNAYSGYNPPSTGGVHPYGGLTYEQQLEQFNSRNK